MTKITNNEDRLFVRDIITRFKELEYIDIKDDDEEQEYQTLESLLDELKGNGEEEKWRGNWYPGCLIRESYFDKTAENYSYIEFDGVLYLYH